MSETNPELERLKKDNAELLRINSQQRERLVEMDLKEAYIKELQANGVKGKVFDADDPRIVKLLMQTQSFLKYVDIEKVSDAKLPQPVGGYDSLKKLVETISAKVNHQVEKVQALTAAEKVA